MPRPGNKEELIEASRGNFEKLNTLIDSYSSEELEKEFPEGTLNRNIRDMLAHLHHWHLMLMEWYETGMKGVKPEMPAKGYSWKTLPELNKKIQEKYRHEPIHKVREMLGDSFYRTQEIITSHTNEELFEKKRYIWTGSTSLGAYLISNTSSHYNWAFNLIRKSMK
ncbi:ClbS/DfsB family four-helix bundle protein [Leptobacterium flavescens]|uniref:ClbS/DfsB family four-helix bundle protein n=1 Tax=Leptobacterium flavescens TaxID=472055 RepID=A0A6P0URE6_9FLAO|nr:ClbS/DfsB family four-helix bundle protein [Leptobacterium flavescens]NER14349.1 ClbS/DfsB family four-helix bundle protein [Leptobacterium flavescens]